jgi:hypothetical protein
LATPMENLPMSLSRLHDLPDGGSDEVHFFGGEPITSCKIAGRASWPHVAFDVWQGVVYAVKATGAFGGLTVNAWRDDHCQDLGTGHVAGVNPLVSLAQEDRPAFVGFGVAFLTRNNLFPLLRRVLCPSVSSIIPPALSVAMAGPTFVGQPKRAGCVAQENLWCRLQKLLASIAVSKTIFWRNKSFSHNDLYTKAIPICKDGPHWQLSWKDYP